MSTRRDAEFTEYVAARLSSLRRLAYLLCRDWDSADDLVQGALIKLYVHWGRARADDHADVSTYGRDASPDAVSIFSRHMRLLGRDPASWTTRPLG